MRPKVVLFLLFIGIQCGCKGLTVRDRWFDTDRVAEVPNEILPIWTDTVLHQPGKPGIRGFGGRIYFYEQGKPNPVMVDGQLAIYAFDGDAKSPELIAPLRKYVFTPDQLTEHHGDSSLGHSYSVWIPWDKVGGESRTLSLVARFDGRNGGTAMSKSARILLPGVSLRDPFLPDEDGKVQLASHDETAAWRDGPLDAVSQENPQQLLNTTSIDLPPSFQRRLMSSSSEFIPATTRPSEANGDIDSAVISWDKSLPVDRREQVNVDNANAALTHPTANAFDLPAATIPQVRASSKDLPVRVADSSPQRFPARRTPKVQPGPSAVRRQLHRAAWPVGLPPTPRNGLQRRNTQDSQAPLSTHLGPEVRQVTR